MMIDGYMHVDFCFGYCLLVVGLMKLSPLIWLLEWSLFGMEVPFF